MKSFVHKGGVLRARAMNRVRGGRYVAGLDGRRYMRMGPGMSKSHDAKKKGTYVFVCIFHECISTRFSLQGASLVEKEV